MRASASGHGQWGPINRGKGPGLQAIHLLFYLGVHGPGTWPALPRSHRVCQPRGLAKRGAIVELACESGKFKVGGC